MHPRLDLDPDPDHVTGFDRRHLIRSAALFGLGGLAATSLSRRAFALPNFPGLDGGRMGSATRVSPSQTLGPYWLNLNLLRQDITEGRPGMPFYLVVRTVRLVNGEPVPAQGAIVDVWHTEALGTYSGFSQMGTQGQTWLRGIQIANHLGEVTFRTIYPGWYPGRTTHIHVRVMLNQAYHLTTQLYFDDGFTAQIYLTQPYLQHGPKPVSNQQDGFYDDDLLVPVWPRPGGGYVAGKTLVVV